jgi:RNA polymerase sigma-70 factor, ECF subfamily
VRPESDVEAVRCLYDDVRGPLWRALLAFSGAVDVADEALAEAFAQLLRRGPGVRDPRAWVWRAAFRIAAGELERRGRFDRNGSALLIERAGVVDRLPDDAVDLVRAIATLSEQQRLCVALVLVADLPAAEVAVLLDTSAATVRVQIMRARRRLRLLLIDPDAAEVDRAR